MKRDFWQLVVLLIGIVLLLWLITGVAQAHTTEEIEQWETDWNERLEEAIPIGGLSLGAMDQILVLLEERRDFESRHRCYFETCVVRTRSSNEGSGTFRGIGDNVEQWRSLVSAYFAPGDVDRALCLMHYESGGNPNAKNPRSSARGLMQILASLWAPHFGVSYEDLYDPATNISIAAQIKASQGWTAWSPYNRGLCR